MNVVYHPFTPHRPLRQYRGQAGHEVNGMLLSPMALDALSKSVTSDIPCELVVRGEHVREDGVRYLDFAVTKAFIEATTDFLDENGTLRLVCPRCEQKDGRHLKSCDR